MEEKRLVAAIFFRWSNGFLLGFLVVGVVVGSGIALVVYTRPDLLFLSFWDFCLLVLLWARVSLLSLTLGLICCSCRFFLCFGFVLFLFCFCCCRLLSSKSSRLVNLINWKWYGDKLVLVALEKGKITCCC